MRALPTVLPTFYLVSRVSPESRNFQRLGPHFRLICEERTASAYSNSDLISSSSDGFLQELRIAHRLPSRPSRFRGHRFRGVLHCQRPLRQSEAEDGEEEYRFQ